MNTSQQVVRKRFDGEQVLGLEFARRVGKRLSPGASEAERAQAIQADDA